MYASEKPSVNRSKCGETKQLGVVYEEGGREEEGPTDVGMPFDGDPPSPSK